jgi:transposase
MQKEFENYWGIDVSKGWLDIAIGSTVCRIEQTEKALVEFIGKNKRFTKQALVVLESTGGYEQLAVDHLSLAGLTVHIAHPNKVKAFGKAKGRLAKTDALDAKLLLDYGRFMEPSTLRDLPSQKQRLLQQLGSRLEQLKAMHHQERCRLGMARDTTLKRSHELLLAVIKEESTALEKQIEDLIQGDAELKEKYAILRSMKGVGPVLAMTLLVDLPELGKATKKEIAALVGVAPLTQQSGQRNGRALTRYGRKNIRKILYMSALTASRYNTTLHHFYERLVKAGKLKKVALVAVMRKMLVILNAMIQSKTCFNS